ncbi:MAG: hypothetical protein H0T18_02425 [Chloroflexia bacterium]|nr:hypothetical protein [Chloroflexia bacterium]
MVEKAVWYQGIRDIHDRHIHDSWEERVDAINQRYQLRGEHILLTHGPGVPMPWFNGDIQSVEPGKWVLVISLNHQIDSNPSEAAPRMGSGSSVSDAWWNARRTMNMDRWYGQFFGPLARVAAAAMREPLSKQEEPSFSARRMVFVEICPYASNKFNLDWPIVKELHATDLGFRLASEVNHLLIEQGEPALVMVNGNSAIEMFRHLYANALDWREVRYDSCHPPQVGRKQKRLRHYCGSLRLGKRMMPVMGFPFLRTPSTHNSNQEVALLGEHAVRCIRSDFPAVSADSMSHHP